MKNTQTIGRLGASLSILFLVLFTAFLFLILPSQGLPANQGGLYEPQSVLDFASHSWLLRGFYAHYLLGVLGFLMIVYARSKQVQNNNHDLGKLRNIIGYIAAGLLFLNGLIQYLNLPLLLYLLPKQPNETYATYLTITLIAGALIYGAFFCMGIWLILSNLGLSKSKNISSIFSYLGILTGIFGVCSVLVTALSFLFIIFMIIWLIWMIIIFPKLMQN